jgi:hypothetical protein
MPVQDARIQRRLSWLQVCGFGAIFARNDVRKQLAIMRFAQAG